MNKSILIATSLVIAASIMILFLEAAGFGNDYYYCEDANTTFVMKGGKPSILEREWHVTGNITIFLLRNNVSELPLFEELDAGFRKIQLTDACKEVTKRNWTKSTRWVALK